MDFQINDRKLPSPINITVSNPKGHGRLLLVWDNVRNPDIELIRNGASQSYLIKEVRYNVYRGLSLGGIFYKMNNTPLDRNRFEDSKVNVHPNIQYFYKVSTVAVLNDNTMVEGELSSSVLFHIPTTNKWFKKINERNMWILKNTAMLMDLYTRKLEGNRCSCYDEVRAQGSGKCLNCYGTFIEGGYEPMSQIYVRLKPAQRSVDLIPQGYIHNNHPGAWTITKVPLKNRDLLFDPNGKLYSVTSSNTNQAAGYLFHQELVLQEVDPLDIKYKIKRATLYPEY